MTTYDTPDVFYSDFTEGASALWIPNNANFPRGGAGKFNRRANWGSAASANGASDDDTADRLVHNGEVQCYTDAGCILNPTYGLQLQAVAGGANPIGAAYSSGIVCQDPRTASIYGYMEARIQFPSACNGLFPAFWSLGQPGGWAWEIDVCEVAQTPANSHGAAFDWANQGAYGASDAPFNSASGNDTAFHKYGMRWDSNGIYFYRDDVPYQTSPSLPPVPNTASIPGYMIMNLALASGPTLQGYTGSVDSSTPTTLNMYVRSMGMWSLNGWASGSQAIPRTPPIVGTTAPNFGGTVITTPTTPTNAPASNSPSVLHGTTGSISDGNGNTITISGNQIAKNGATDTSTSAVALVLFLNGAFYYQTTTGVWHSYSVTTGSGAVVTAPIATSAAYTTVTTAGPALYDAALHSYVLTGDSSGYQILVDGLIDTTSQGVLIIKYIPTATLTPPSDGSTGIYQYNTFGNWYSEPPTRTGGTTVTAAAVATPAVTPPAPGTSSGTSSSSTSSSTTSSGGSVTSGGTVVPGGNVLSNLIDSTLQVVSGKLGIRTQATPIAQNSSHTLQAGDTELVFNNTSPVTIVCPSGVAEGNSTIVIQNGVGSISFIGDGSSTVTVKGGASPSIAFQFGVVCARVVGLNQWLVTGDVTGGVTTGGTASTPVTTIATSGTSQALTFPTTGRKAYNITKTGNVVLTLTGAIAAGSVQEIRLVVLPGAGGFTETLPTGIIWSGGLAPTPSTTAINSYLIYTLDGSTILGSY